MPRVPYYGSLAPGSKQFLYPAKVSYECLSRYDLSGASERRCLANGKWSGDVPTCRGLLATLIALSPALSLALSPALSLAFSPARSPARSPELSPAFNPALSPALSPELSPARSPARSPALSPAFKVDAPDLNNFL